MWYFTIRQNGKDIYESKDLYWDSEDCWEEAHKKSIELTGSKWNAQVHFGHYAEIGGK